MTLDFILILHRLVGLLGKSVDNSESSKIGKALLVFFGPSLQVTYSIIKDTLISI